MYKNDYYFLAKLWTKNRIMICGYNAKDEKIAKIDYCPSYDKQHPTDYLYDGFDWYRSNIKKEKYYHLFKNKCVKIIQKIFKYKLVRQLHTYVYVYIYR